MEQRTCNIIRCCKGSINIPGANNASPEGRIAAYMSKECDCPKEDYTGSLLEMILRQAAEDYFRTADKPWVDVHNLLTVGTTLHPYPTMIDRYITMFRLVQVRDGKRNYINGFTNELVDQCYRDLMLVTPPSGSVVNKVVTAIVKDGWDVSWSKDDIEMTMLTGKGDIVSINSTMDMLVGKMADTIDYLRTNYSDDEHLRIADKISDLSHVVDDILAEDAKTDVENTETFAETIVRLAKHMGWEIEPSYDGRIKMNWSTDGGEIQINIDSYPVDVAQTLSNMATGLREKDDNLSQSAAIMCTHLAEVIEASRFSIYRTRGVVV